MNLDTEIASLHAGDRVLEVNGLPVSGNNMATIEKLINDAQEDVQVSRVAQLLKAVVLARVGLVQVGTIYRVTLYTPPQTVW